MKLFLAGAESPEYMRCLSLMDYPYRLLSYLSLKRISQAALEYQLEEIRSSQAEWFLDSGVFSLVFGSEAVKKDQALKTPDDFYRYASDYVEWCHKVGWKHKIVELDVQNVIGRDETEKLRRRVFDQCSLPVVYVWHFVDGLTGARELADQCDHVAIGSIMTSKGKSISNSTYVKAVLRLLYEFRQHGDPTVHLLGATSQGLMELPIHSCDSTSWLNATRFGKGFVMRGRRLVDAPTTSPLFMGWLRYCQDTYPDVFEQVVKPYQRRCLASAYAFWMAMEKINGE